MKKLLRNLSFWVFAAMILGILVGYLMGPSAHVLAPLGTLFMQLIQMLVVPLVFISIVSGAATLGGSRSAGRIGVTSIGYILITTLISTVLAILAGLWFTPGSGLDASSIDLLASQNTTDMSAPPSLTFWGTIIGMIPANPVRALTEGNILQIIVFGLFLGFGISTLAAGKKEPVIRGVNYLLEALIWCINKVMLVAPLGVFGLMADATGTFGFDILLSVANLLWVDILVVLAMGLGIYPITIALFSRTPVTHFFRSMAEPQIVAFSTSSSMATLPVNVSFINAPRDFDESVLVYELSRKQLKVAGPAEKIDALSTLSIGTIDLSTFTLNKVYELPIELPSDIYLLDNISTITLSFDCSGLETKTMNLPSSCVQVVNLPSTYQLTVETERLMNVTLCGPKAALETLTPEQVVVEIDAEDFSVATGQQNIACRLYVPSNGKIFALGSYVLQCRIESN